MGCEWQPMITVKFFANIRERLSLDQIELAADPINTISDIIVMLETELPGWSQVVADNQLLCALNHTIVVPDSAVSDNDEVAFFPPVTGG